MRKGLFYGIILIITLLIAGKKNVLAPGSKQRINGVPAYHQYPDLPTGCEATSLAMLLSWGCGEDVSKYEVADAMPKGAKVQKSGDGWTGGHPNKTFVGDPYTDSNDGSYGVFEKPVLKTIEMFMPGYAINLTGQSFESLLDIVRSGRPVMAWTTLEQRRTFYGLSWTDTDGDVIDWYENEHAVVLVGVDRGHVIAHDPHTGKAEFYNRDLFERNWRSMGERAVTLKV